MYKDYKACKCGWCAKETTRTYQLKSGNYLCLECATKHFNSVNIRMENHITNIRVGLNKKRTKLLEFKQRECKHENAFPTGYNVGMGENCKNIWSCPDCGKTIYKEELN